ncbi:MAG: alkaline phosphatase family protein, partial [Gammaproteobacteria bacterium]
MNQEHKTISVNGRDYRWPDRPVVVVCIDGSEPDYIEQAIAAGVMPWMKKIVEQQGVDLRAHCVVPTFTNPNNISIVTGVPPVVHGINGNFYYDRTNDCEVMMNEPHLLRTPTIFKAFQDAGAKIAIVTAKDKLRRLLGNELTFGEDGAICFSSEKSDQATLEENGIDDVLELVGMEVPSVYSAELSEFIFAAGVRLMEKVRPDLMYLSTTDYIQHKFAPGSEGANAFYAMMDKYWA